MYPTQIREFNMQKTVLSYLFIVIFAVTSAFMSCGSSSNSRSSGTIKMTTEKDGEFSFILLGSGIATVDWGDDSENVSLMLDGEEEGVEFAHTYPDSTIRTIIINGDNILGLICQNITSLDVSKNTKLTHLSCLLNQITSLDMSGNTALKYLNCIGNQLTSSALNDLFRTLHSNPGEKKIYIVSNPGTSNCDRSIAEKKGWTVK